MAEEYVCSLDEASLKVARDELNEDPRERLGQVEALKEWILQQPHLKCPTDTQFLLSFLRTAKFSQLRARTMIDNFLTLKTETPEWFSNIDMTDPKLLTFLKSGVMVLLPKRINGRLAILSRIGKIDLTEKEYTLNDFTKCAMGMYFWVMENETTQVNGVMALRDYTDVSINILSLMKSANMKKASKMWENTIPGRLKGFHFYNAGPILDTIMAMAKPFLSQKLKSRMYVYGSNLEEVYKVFPMETLPDEYLPDDYTGPRTGSIQKLTDDLVETLTSPKVRNRILELTSDAYGVDESKRPSEVPKESFRKLQVD